MHAHDLNARTLELAKEHNCTFAEARQLLAARGGLVRRRNQKATAYNRHRERAGREREERMGLH